MSDEFTKQRIEMVVGTLKEAGNSAYAAWSQDLFDKVKALEIDKGLLEINRDGYKTRLESCERALAEREAELVSIRKERDEANKWQQDFDKAFVGKTLAGVVFDRIHMLARIGRLTELRKENEWIPVTERLPEDDLKDSAGIISVAVWVRFDGGLWLQAQFDEGEFGIDDDGGIKITKDVTHWKPITPPSEQ